MIITKFRVVDKGNLVGFASVDLPSGMYINDLAIFCKNGFRWVNFPSREYIVDGVKKYAPHLGLKDKAKKDEFDKKFLAALDDYLRRNPQPEPQVNEFGASSGQSPKNSYAPKEELPF